MRLYPRDGIALGFCARGQKRFCEANGIDPHRWFREGIDASEVAHLDDAHVAAMIEVAKRREGLHGPQ